MSPQFSDFVTSGFEKKSLECCKNATLHTCLQPRVKDATSSSSRGASIRTRRISIRWSSHAPQLANSRVRLRGSVDPCNSCDGEFRGNITDPAFEASYGRYRNRDCPCHLAPAGSSRRALPPSDIANIAFDRNWSGRRIPHERAPNRTGRNPTQRTAALHSAAEWIAGRNPPAPARRLAESPTLLRNPLWPIQQALETSSDHSPKQGGLELEESFAVEKRAGFRRRSSIPDERKSTLRQNDPQVEIFQYRKDIFERVV